ncbi:hypothetical protein LTR56_000282 [Elasticomyces elasticus]|nr:hypothetical protein LTR56_000282 [Elasticomyces elasticus]KAK3667023.1 hypothetical protein LTR22_002248 [Elasticomyces elasticus]KAK4933274.1 hypothetical protein LTR49_000268 [Elasticomyces elasticus]KAK5757372.1 hypothetical protein LTS12_012584 [Elasticomyces elasticus]
MAPSSIHAHSDLESQGAAGVLTKTVVRSPVIHWILHARIRHKTLNDAVFVGNDFVHVRQVGQQGHLEHIATKDDFDAQIRAAAVFKVDPDPFYEDFLVKIEDGTAAHKSAAPDLLVLTLSTNDLVFIYLEVQSDGSLQFVQQTLPLPTFDHILYQPGEHVAIDPHYRALAVAASEREVIIYSAKPRASVAQQIRSGDQKWCPVAAQRPLQVDGIIQHIDFLIPPDDDEDHIILLLVVIDRLKTKAIWIDWNTATDLHQAQIHRGEPLSSIKTVSSMLVPLRNAAFLVITGNDVRRYKNILTGSISGIPLGSLVDETDDDHDGNSPLRPLWASWCRPHRHRGASREKDHIYLVREDGLVLYIYVMVEGTISNLSAGHLRCHVGRAFASLGDTEGPDILAVAGEMSTGRVVSIGHWPSTNGARVNNLGWQETMEMGLIQDIPNWASSADMVASRLPQSHGRMVPSRDGLYMTSGRQPHGSITEIRYGLEARSTRVELEESQVVTAIWAVPMASNGSLLVLMATPTSTMVYELDASGDETAMISHETEALDLQYRTLEAAITAEGNILQVTEHSICETTSLVANFEDTTILRCDSGDSIKAAAFDSGCDYLVTAQWRKGAHILSCLQLPLSTHSNSMADADDSADWSLPLPSAPLTIAVALMGNKTIAAVATSEHGVILCGVTLHSMKEICRIMPQRVQDLPNLCDHLVLLRNNVTSDIMLVCGLRDGRLHTTVLTIGDNGELHTVNAHTVVFGQSTVRVVAMANQPSQACVMAGPDTCLLQWNGRNADSLCIESLWYSDKDHPGLAQTAVVGCAQVPASDYLAAQHIVGSLAMVSGGHFLLSVVDTTPTAVPRQLEVSGTPNRLIYAEQQKCMVVASLRTGLRAISTNGRTDEKRQIWPVIDFIPSRDSQASYAHDLQPGERVYALLEWSFKEVDKTYAHILVGGSYVKRNGTPGGRISFLQPSHIGSEAASVRSGTSSRFDAPVYALSLYDDLTYVVCYGRFVSLYSFSPKERKWEELCRPLPLANSGVYITVAAPLIHVSTMEDSMITLQLVATPNEDGIAAKLVLVASSPQADRALSHLVLSLPGADAGEHNQVALVSTSDRKIVGLSCRAPNDSVSRRPIADRLLFEADLPRSFTRIRQSDIRPPWKSPLSHGVLLDNIIGTANDGTVLGIALLGNDLWQRLFWLQRMCEWTNHLSPHSWQIPPYSAADSSYDRNERPLPIGINGNAHGDEVMLRTSVDIPTDKHIDGDVLARLLQRGGAQTLERMLRETAEHDDQAGTWMREHLDDELAAVSETIEMLRSVLDRWV